MLLTELMLNPSVKPEDETRLSQQAIRVWQLFCDGRNTYRPVWTSALRAVAAQYNARINEIRTWLRTYGLTIDNTGTNGNGDHEYRVREFEGSNYQKVLRRRGLA